MLARRLVLHSAQVTSAERPMGARAKTVKLQVDGRRVRSDCMDKARIPCEAEPIRVEHHMPDAALTGRTQDLDDLRMDRRLATTELQHLGSTLRFDKAVENRLHLSQAQVVAGTRVGKAGGTLQVAARGDLHHTHARMLLVLGAEPAVVWTALIYVGGKRQGDRSRLVKADRV